MKIVLRLVGYTEIINSSKYIYEIEFFSPKLNSIIIKNHLIKFEGSDINDEELDNCIFTCNTINLKKEELDEPSDDVIKKVYVYVINSEIKNKLISLFKTNGELAFLGVNNTPVITTPVLTNEEKTESSSESSSEEEEEDEEDKEDEDDSENEVIVSPNINYFDDPDFVNLIRIYNNKPELYKNFYKYISSGNIIKINTNPNIDCSKNIELIKIMELGFDEEQIKNALIATNNHLNLSIRYLLFNK